VLIYSTYMLVIPSVKVDFSIAESSFYVFGSDPFCIFHIKTTVQINNAGTNKGFRPLLQFSDEDIKQVCVNSHSFSVLRLRCESFVPK